MRFETKRADGKSARQVILEHVHGHEPGTVFTYNQLEALLELDGTDDENRRTIQHAARACQYRLLRDYKRTLVSVPTVGYRLALAREHRGLADDKTRRGFRQMRRALDTLENARLDEMTQGERELHLAQCELNSRLYYEQRRVAKKQDRHDQLIARLTARLDQIEAVKG